MVGIEPNLLTKNRDRFTQNLSMFRRDINDLLKGAAGVSGGNNTVFATFLMADFRVAKLSDELNPGLVVSYLGYLL
ncbi:hypothetical protein B5X24_HaOG216048 [Helicoverpa armigera]|uniref:Uncharacterized protein n=1 Tax=Helicoverpa armigera TaxID=29058 RepID=A0A2W1B878_HELAM|nr:hypothetical protein B5X24_HaOG216048 [Helicoverpa armigera]